MSYYDIKEDIKRVKARYAREKEMKECEVIPAGGESGVCPEESYYEEKEREEMKLMDKINKINEVYKDDELIIEMLNDTIHDASKYVDVVTRNEALIRTLKFRLEGYDFRIRVQELDELRRRTHNGLIANLKALNRLLCSEGNEDLILFNGNINDRYQIADWAMASVKEIFDNRRL